MNSGGGDQQDDYWTSWPGSWGKKYQASLSDSTRRSTVDPPNVGIAPRRSMDTGKESGMKWKSTAASRLAAWTNTVSIHKVEEGSCDSPPLQPFFLNPGQSGMRGPSGAPPEYSRWGTTHGSSNAGKGGSSDAPAARNVATSSTSFRSQAGKGGSSDAPPVQWSSSSVSSRLFLQTGKGGSSDAPQRRR